MNMFITSCYFAILTGGEKYFVSSPYIQHVSQISLAHDSEK